MTIAWCSPSPRKNPPKAKEEEAGEEEEEDESVQQLEQCARAYKCLEDCLVKTDRNWRACQKEVRALKECHDAKANKQPSSVSLDAAAQEVARILMGDLEKGDSEENNPLSGDFVLVCMARSCER